MTVVVHGVRSSYARGCRCPECKEANRNYRRIQRPSRTVGLSLDDTEVPTTALPVRGEWRDLALCLELVATGEADAGWWYEDSPGSSAKYQRARRICAGCPVADDCLAWALELPERFGLWGGKSPKERRAISRSRRRICKICDATFEPDPGQRRVELCSDACRHQSKLRRQALWNVRNKMPADA